VRSRFNFTRNYRAGKLSRLNELKEDEIVGRRHPVTPPSTLNDAEFMITETLKGKSVDGFETVKQHKTVPNQNQRLTKRLGFEGGLQSWMKLCGTRVRYLHPATIICGSNGTRIPYLVIAEPQLRKKLRIAH